MVSMNVYSNPNPKNIKKKILLHEVQGNTWNMDLLDLLMTLSTFRSFSIKQCIITTAVLGTAVLLRGRCR